MESLAEIHLSDAAAIRRAEVDGFLAFIRKEPMNSHSYPADSMLAECYCAGWESAHDAALAVLNRAA